MGGGVKTDPINYLFIINWVSFQIQCLHSVNFVICPHPPSLKGSLSLTEGMGRAGVSTSSQQNEIEIVILDMGESKSLSIYVLGSIIWFSQHNTGTGELRGVKLLYMGHFRVLKEKKVSEGSIIWRIKTGLSSIHLDRLNGLNVSILNFFKCVKN